MKPSDNPYRNLPASSYWRKSVASIQLEDIDPVTKVKFRIRRDEKIATAGSCFAQHISRHLVRLGFTYFVSERPHSLLPEHLYVRYSYGVFSARYGNIYTCKQLVQLFLRAYGELSPVDSEWRSASGTFIDPYRPTVVPGGFSTREEFEIARQQHFQAVRRMFEQLDVFVFTLGLTEAWGNAADGVVYPLCPGSVEGVFDPSQHNFVNFSYSETVSDLSKFLELLKKVNQHARVLLTVSPVPLVATAEDRHVLVSTVASKSVLRAAADEVAKTFDFVDYFPSFEIITGSFSKGKYFAEDLRSVTEAGVAHVMRVFTKHYASDATGSTDGYTSANDAATVEAKGIFDAIQVMCDEENLDKK